MKRAALSIVLAILACAAFSRADPPREEHLAATLDNWVIEKWEDGAVDVKARADHLHVITHSKEHGVMLWLKRELPKDFIFEYDFTPRSQTGFFLLFFCARGVEGDDVLAQKVQADHTSKTLFKKYTDGRIRSYHVSYRRGEEANCNLRKNPGLHLLKQEKFDAILPKDKTVHVKLTHRGGRILLEVDGKVFMDYSDPDAPWQGGRLALRQVYDSDAEYSKLILTDLSHE